MAVYPFRTFRLRGRFPNLVPFVAVAGVMFLAAFLGSRASIRLVVAVVVLVGLPLLLRYPTLGLAALVVFALLFPSQIGTGTAVDLNLSALLVPVLLLIWLWSQLGRSKLGLAPSRSNMPLLFFLAAGLLSLLVGTATWDPMVPRSSNLLLVQLTQWAIFAFSAGVFWLTGNLIKSETALRRLVTLYLILAGSLALFCVLPFTAGFVSRVATSAFQWAPFSMLLAALAAGQLLFNRRLAPARRIFLAIILLAAVVYGFVNQRETISHAVGISAALGVLAWLRFPRLRWLMVVVIIVLAVTGVLFPSIYNFAGGDMEWIGSGAPRLVLIQRVLEVTMRNPITGLGPAAYRSYAGMTPLAYQHAYWLQPAVNSHNNYVDLFAHTGILGLSLFAWFAVAFARTGLRLRSRYREGFAAGYLNGALAAGAGALVLMLFADWILPHVYNIGFPGFQASVLVWLFLGGVVFLDNLPEQANADSE